MILTDIDILLLLLSIVLGYQITYAIMEELNIRKRDWGEED